MAASIPKTMKAWQFSSTSPTLEKNLKLNNSSTLPPTATKLAADTVLVQVLAVSLNPVDFKFPEIPLLGRLMVGSPSIPGLDYAGKVVATGPNSKKQSSTDLKVGEYVWGRLDGPSQYGTMAEYTVAPRKGCVALPKGISLVDGAAAGTVGLTAYQCIVPKFPAGQAVGKHIFINGGSGGTGTYGIQIAKNIGCHVTVTCSSRNRSLCEKLGADVVIDYTKGDVVTQLQKLPYKFDLVMDGVGSPANLYWHSHTFLHDKAPYVQIGAPISWAFVWESLTKALWPTFLGGGQRPWEFLGVESKVDHFEQLAKWMAEGKLKATIDEVYGMEDKGPVRAFEKVRSGRTQGKAVVKVVDEPGQA